MCQAVGCKLNMNIHSSLPHLKQFPKYQIKFF